MPLKLNTASSGSVTLDAANTASNFTITVPATTATMAINGPTFSAFQSASSQSISNDTHTKITFDAEEWDTNSNFASSRFTPTVAGYYQLSASVLAGLALPCIVILSFYKNGSAYKRVSQLSTSGSNVMPASSAMVYANGTTDYFEVYYLQNSGTTVTTNNNSAFTWFQGAMVRSA